LASKQINYSWLIGFSKKESKSKINIYFHILINKKYVLINKKYGKTCDFVPLPLPLQKPLPLPLPLPFSYRSVAVPLLFLTSVTYSPSTFHHRDTPSLTVPHRSTPFKTTF
jgi:hypothetical protein